MQHKLTFANFVAKFPPVAMPVTLGEDTHHAFGTENEPLTDELIVQFIHPTEGGGQDDPYTEYVPCFAIDNTEQFIALVWWKAELMNYEYVLATFTAKGELIDSQVIAQTKVEEGKIYHAVATISSDLEIVIAEGLSADDDSFDPASSRTRELEVLANGEIVAG
jgi:hypothetical protein